MAFIAMPYYGSVATWCHFTRAMTAGKPVPPLLEGGARRSPAAARFFLAGPDTVWGGGGVGRGDFKVLSRHARQSELHPGKLFYQTQQKEKSKF